MKSAMTFGMATAILALAACSGGKTENAASGSGETTAAAAAAKMPKAGLWEMKVAAAGLPQATTSKVCVGETPAGTNPFKLQSGASESCSKNEIKETATGYSIETECAANGMTVNSSGTVSGDFDVAYKIDLTTKMSGPNLPAAAQQEAKTTIDAKYLGECPAGMTAGQTS